MLVCEAAASRHSLAASPAQTGVESDPNEVNAEAAPKTMARFASQPRAQTASQVGSRARAQTASSANNDILIQVQQVVRCTYF